MAGENKDFEITRDGDQDGAQSVFGETAGTPEQEAMYSRFQERFGAQKEAARAALKLMSEAEMAKLRADVAAGREQEAAQAVAAKFLEYYVLDFAQLEKDFSVAGLAAKLEKIEKSGEFAPSLCSSLLKVLSRRGYAVALDAGKPVVEAKADAKPSAAEVQAVLSGRAAASPAFSDALRRGLVFQTSAAAEVSDKPAKTSEVAANLRKKYGLEKDADFTAENIRAKVSDAGDRAFLLSYRATPEFGVQDALEKSREQVRKATELLEKNFPGLRVPAGAKVDGAVASVVRDPFTAAIQFMNKGPFIALSVMALFVVALFKNWKATLGTLAGLGIAKELGGLDWAAGFLGSDKAKDLAQQAKTKIEELPDQARGAYGRISERLSGKLTPAESQKFHLDLTNSADFGAKTAGQLHAALAKGGDLRGFFGDIGSVAGVTGAAYYGANQDKLKKYLSALDQDGYSEAHKDEPLASVLGGTLAAVPAPGAGETPAPTAPLPAGPEAPSSGVSEGQGLFAVGTYLSFQDGVPTLFTRDGKRSRVDENMMSPEAREAVKSQADLSLFLETYQIWRAGVQRMTSGLMLKVIRNPLFGTQEKVEQRLRQVDSAVNEAYRSATSGELPPDQVRAKVGGLIGIMKEADRQVLTDEAFDDAKYAEMEKILTTEGGTYEQRLLKLMDAMRQGLLSDGDSQAVRERAADYLVHSDRKPFAKVRETLANPAAYATVKDDRSSEWAKLGIPDSVAAKTSEFQKKLHVEANTRRSLDATRAKIKAAAPDLPAVELDAAVTRALEEGVRVATMTFLEGKLVDDVIANDPSVAGDDFVKMVQTADANVNLQNAIDTAVNMVVTVATLLPGGFAVRGVGVASEMLAGSKLGLYVGEAAQGSKLASAVMTAGSMARIGAEGFAFYETQAVLSGILYREKWSDVGSDMADGTGIAKSVAFMGVMAAVTKVAGPSLSKMGAMKEWTPVMSKQFVATQLIPRVGLIAAEGGLITAVAGGIDVMFDQPHEWTVSEFVQGMALVAMMRGMTPKGKARDAARYDLYKNEGKVSLRPETKAELRAKMEKLDEEIVAARQGGASAAEIDALTARHAELRNRHDNMPAVPAAQLDFGMNVGQKENAVMNVLKAFAKDKSALELDLGGGLKAEKVSGKVKIDGQLFDTEVGMRKFVVERFAVKEKAEQFGSFVDARWKSMEKDFPKNLYRFTKENWFHGGRFQLEGKPHQVEFVRDAANPQGKLMAREILDGKNVGGLRELGESDRAALMQRFAERFEADINGGRWAACRKALLEQGLLDPKNRDAMAEAYAKGEVKSAMLKCLNVLWSGVASPSLTRKIAMGTVLAGGAGASIYQGANRPDKTGAGELADGAFDMIGWNMLGLYGLIPAYAYDKVS